MRYPVTGDLITPEAAKIYKLFCKEVGSEKQAASIIIRAGLDEVMKGYEKRADVADAAAKADEAAGAARQKELAALKLKQEAAEKAAAEALSAKASGEPAGAVGSPVEDAPPGEEKTTIAEELPPVEDV